MAAFPAGTPPLNRRSPGGKTKANRIPPLERRTVPDNMRLLQPPQLLQVFFHLGLVALAGMSHPFPSRTRPLSSPVAMILRSRAWESSALPVLFLSPGPVGILHRRAPGFFSASRQCREATEGIFSSREGAKARRRQRQRKMAACLAAARQFTPPIKRREGAVCSGIILGASW